MKGLRQACTRLSRTATPSIHGPASIDPGEIIDILELITMLRRARRTWLLHDARPLFNRRTRAVAHRRQRTRRQARRGVQFVPSPPSTVLARPHAPRPGDHPRLIDYALCSTIATSPRGRARPEPQLRRLSLGARSERGDGTLTRVERWPSSACRDLAHRIAVDVQREVPPSWLPRYLVYPARELRAVVAAVLRAESITELPVLGRSSPTTLESSGTVVPDEVLERQK